MGDAWCALWTGMGMGCIVAKEELQPENSMTRDDFMSSLLVIARTILIPKKSDYDMTGTSDIGEFYRAMHCCPELWAKVEAHASSSHLSHEECLRALCELI